MYEYKIVITETIPYTADLNRLGKEGWKMCASCTAPSNKIGGVQHVTYFIRYTDPMEE